ncbi:MAG TPA: hypothetical protein VG028_05200 [Terriglobia bacterium]|nr:hypothetical protein [Terriglobia bacterium]
MAISQRCSGQLAKVCPYLVMITCMLAWPVCLWSQTAPKVTVFSPTPSSDAQQTLIIEISGTNLTTPDVPRILVFPATNTGEVTTLDSSAALIDAKFSVPKNYILEEVVLSHSTGAPQAIMVARATCTPETDIKSTYNIVTENQAKNKYGNGVAENFDIFQLSMVNECSLPVVIPLAGIKFSVKVDSRLVDIVPFSLEHVTSVYSTDRKLTGRRAVFFNFLQAVATLGSAVEPFFGRGFTQGVSIWGGGFTQAMTTVFKDMSAEQLQNITAQSFGSTEQLGPNGGSLQKFLFVPKRPTGEKGKQKLSLAGSFAQGEVSLNYEAIPTMPGGMGAATPKD